MADINKETLESLLSLARIQGDTKEAEEKEEKLLGDLRRILDHVAELGEVETNGIAPLSGGKAGQNAFRKDDERLGLSGLLAREAFPEEEKGYLKVPAVLEHKKTTKKKK
jgi:aspartyl/glutamyl-tRNA(Asn/Gln) amidotransferase C subunit